MIKLLGGKRKIKGQKAKTNRALNRPTQAKPGEKTLSKFYQNKILLAANTKVYTSSQLRQLIKLTKSEKVKNLLEEIEAEILIVEGESAENDLILEKAIKDKTKLMTILKNEEENTVPDKVSQFKSIHYYDENLIPKGLTNYGNTCYLNSTLQCLANNTNFVKQLDLYLNENKVENLNFNLTCRQPQFTRPLFNVLEGIKGGIGLQSKLQTFLRTLEKSCPQFVGRRQQDAHEVFVAAISEMKQNEIIACKKSLLQKFNFNLNVDHKKISQEKRLEIKKLYEENVVKFPINQNFNGNLANLIKCETCQKYSTCTENFSCLSLPITTIRGKEPENSLSSSSESIENVIFKNKTDKTEKFLVDESKYQSFIKNIDDTDMINWETVKTATKKCRKNKKKKVEQEPTNIPLPHSSGNEADVESSDNSDLFFNQSIDNIQNKIDHHQDLIQNSMWNKNNTSLNSPHVMASLISLSKPEIMNGVNKIDCEKCKIKQIGTRISVITKLPKILVIHLKRYKQGGKRLVKDNTCVKFDEHLNIKGSLYELTSIIEHSGGLSSGHYTATVKINQLKSEKLSKPNNETPKLKKRSKPKKMSKNRQKQLEQYGKKNETNLTKDLGKLSVDDENDLNETEKVDSNGENVKTKEDSDENEPKFETAWYYCSDSRIKRNDNLRYINPYMLFYKLVE